MKDSIESLFESDRLRPSQYEVCKILDDHARWLSSGRQEGRRAYFYRCDLAGRNLQGADLSYASLDYTDFTNANLSGANLQHCAMHKSIFKGADLHGANLSEAYLSLALLKDTRVEHELRAAGSLGRTYMSWNLCCWVTNHLDFSSIQFI